MTAHQCVYNYPDTVNMRSYNSVTKGHRGHIKKAVDLLLLAKRPMIYTGGGIVLGEASKSLTEMVQLLGYPITQTLMGLGAFPADNALSVGMLGMHGTYEAKVRLNVLERLADVPDGKYIDVTAITPSPWARVRALP